MRVYEINTVPWLAELSGKYGNLVTLDNIPDAEWDALRGYHFDAIWLMGVWQRSPQGAVLAQATEGVVADAARVLPGFERARDITGSPYSVKAYVAEQKIGGAAGLATARRELKARGLQLFLDFVPNHTAPDHDWLLAHPEYYVRGTAVDLDQMPQRFSKVGGNVVAFGSPSADSSDVWHDTAQLNAFSPDFRAAAITTLKAIGDQCDGVRCDMALLSLDDAFARLWGSWAGGPQKLPFWSEVIAKVRLEYPKMTFIGEAYSNTEWTLQQQGFDYCYDKDLLYDRLARGNADSIRQHLAGAPLQFQNKLIRFTENHDEKPASECFQPQERQWMAAIAVATLPGASLWYDQQFEGRWGKMPVQLQCPVTVRHFYRQLLVATDRPAIREGTWSLCEVTQSGSMIAWCWHRDDDRVLVVINVSEDASTWGQVKVPWEGLQGRNWKLRNLLTGMQFPAHAAQSGVFYFSPRRWGADIFELLPI